MTGAVRIGRHRRQPVSGVPHTMVSGSPEARSTFSHAPAAALSLTLSAVTGAPPTRSDTASSRDDQLWLLTLISPPPLDGCGHSVHIPSGMTAVIRSNATPGPRVRLAHELLGTRLEDAEKRLVRRDDRGAEVAHRLPLPPPSQLSCPPTRARQRAERVGPSSPTVVLDEEGLPRLGLSVRAMVRR